MSLKHLQALPERDTESPTIQALMRERDKQRDYGNDDKNTRVGVLSSNLKILYLMFRRRVAELEGALN